MDKKMITKKFFCIVIALMLAVALVIPVAVVSAAPALATRDLPASADAGADFSVGIEASGCGVFGQVVETLPSGFSYVGTDSTDVNVTQDGNTISFTFIGDAVTFDYTVTASATEGSYSFSGIVKDEDRIDKTTGGDTDITVGLPAEDATPSTVVDPATEDTTSPTIVDLPPEAPTPPPAVNPSPEPTAPSEEPLLPPPPPAGPGSWPILWTIIGGVVLVGLIILVLARRRAY
jgi:hypothetical protein